MADIKDGWVVIPSPVFFDERTAADAFASTFGGEEPRGIVSRTPTWSAMSTPQ